MSSIWRTIYVAESSRGAQLRQVPADAAIGGNPATLGPISVDGTVHSSLANRSPTDDCMIAPGLDSDATKTPTSAPHRHHGGNSGSSDQVAIDLATGDCSSSSRVSLSGYVLTSPLARRIFAIRRSDGGYHLDMACRSAGLLVPRRRFIDSEIQAERPLQCGRFADSTVCPHQL